MASAPVTFTSDLDSAPGQWAGLFFEMGSGDLRHVTVRYGGQFDVVMQSNVKVVTGTLYMESSRVVSEYQALGRPDYGLYAQNSQVVISDTLFTDNGDDPEDDGGLFAAGGNVNLVNCIFQANTGHGIVLKGRDTVVTIADSRIVGNGGDGLLADEYGWGQGTLHITGTYILSNTQDGIDYNGGATPVMRSSYLYGNGGMGVRNRTQSICFDAIYNYWGGEEGPYDWSNADDGCMGPIANLDGAEEVTDDVDYSPWMKLQYYVQLPIIVRSYSP
jgi:hypothetical protein